MRHTHLFLISLSTLIVACGGGGGSSDAGSSALPPAIPTASVSGSAVDGLIIQGTVSVYNFAGGAKGALLGTSPTDSVGHYRITIQSESTPVLIEVSGGYYLEEASGTRVSLQSDQILTALANFKTGASISMAITPWTHIATALAKYNYNRGTELATAIDSANSRVSALLGINIETTIPVDVMNIANQSATLTPGLQYGWMSAAISLWTYNASASNPLTQHNPPYTSINFSQLMYEDVIADGLLDGIGKTGPLSFGTTALGTNVYRHNLAVDMLAFTSNSNNKTGLTNTHLLSAARNFANSADPIWNGMTPVSIENPALTLVTPIADSWVHDTIPIAASVSDAAGLLSTSLLIDGIPVKSVTSGSLTPSIVWDSTTVPDGDHSVSMVAMNTAGLTGSSAITVRVDNTKPVVSLTGFSVQSSANWQLPVCLISGSSSDAGSGLSSITIALSDNTGVGTEMATLSAPSNTWQVALTQHVAATSRPFDSVATLTITHTDVAGNATVLTRTVRSYATILVKIGYIYTFCELQ